MYVSQPASELTFDITAIFLWPSIRNLKIIDIVVVRVFAVLSDFFPSVSDEFPKLGCIRPKFQFRLFETENSFWAIWIVRAEIERLIRSIYSKQGALSHSLLSGNSIHSYVHRLYVIYYSIKSVGWIFIFTLQSSRDWLLAGKIELFLHVFC